MESKKMFCDECGGLLELCHSDNAEGTKEEWCQCLNCGKDFDINGKPLTQGDDDG